MRISTKGRSGTLPATTIVLAVLAVLPFLPIGDRMYLVLAIGIIYAIAAVGIDIWSGYCGQLTFGNFGFIAIGAYASAILSAKFGWAPELTIFGSMVVAGLVGLVLGAATVRLPHLGTAMGTFFFASTVAVALRGALLSPLTNGPNGLPVESVTIGGEPIRLAGLYWLAFFQLVIVTAITYRFANSRAGRVLRLIKRSEVVAESMGVHVISYKLSAFVWSTMAAGIAGFTYAQAIEYVIPEGFPAFESVILLTMAIIGGLGSIAGPIVGAVLFTVGGELTRSAGDIRQILFAILLLANLIIIPDGLYAIVDRINNLFHRKPGAEAEPAAIPDPAPVIARPEDTANTARYDLSDSILELEGIIVRFGGVTAIDAVDVGIARHSIHAIIGPNGAGKTTLLNCISGLQHHEGNIRFNGDKVVGGSARGVRRSGISRTFQNPSLVGDLTVLENVELGTYGASPSLPLVDIVPLPSTIRRDREARRMAQEALDAVGFPADRRSLLASELSLADQKTVDIARAIVGKPELLLLDEPTAGLSESEIEVIARVLKQVNRHSAVTIVVIAHHIGFVREVADRATVLDFGKKIAEGEPDEVTRRKEVMDVFLGAEHA